MVGLLAAAGFVVAGLFATAAPEPAAVIVLGGWRFDPMTPQLAGMLAEAATQEERLAQLGFESAQSVARFNRQLAVLDQQATGAK